MISKKHLFISIVLIIVVTIGIVIFLQPIQQNSATEKMVESLQKQYDDSFKVTWSDINEQANIKNYHATVKSTKTNYVYDVVVQDGKATIDYEAVNAQMALNESFEQAVPNSFASHQDDKLILLTTQAINEQQLVPHIAQTIKTVEIYELNEDNYSIATKHIDEFYQRSTMPINDLAQYNPKTYSIQMQH